MDEFLNIKYDDEAEDEEEAPRLRDEIVVQEGEGTEVREAEAAEHEVEAQGEEVLISGTTRGVTHKVLKSVRLVLQKDRRSLN